MEILDENGYDRRVRPALTAEEKQRECESLAYNLAKRKLEDGTASPQIIVHFLKLSTARTELEERKLESEVRLAEAKILAMESAQRQEEQTERVLQALRRYQGSTLSDGDDNE